jgi:phospholipid transport system substrate-binding protein
VGKYHFDRWLIVVFVRNLPAALDRRPRDAHLRKPSRGRTGIPTAESNVEDHAMTSAAAIRMLPADGIFGGLRRFAQGLGIVAVLAAGAATPPSAAAAQDPQAFVQSIGDQVVQILRQQLPREQAEQQLNAVWLQAFDVAGIGRAVLGPHWKSASEEQRQAYMDVFPKYVAMLYAIQFSDYSGETFEVNGRAAPSGADTLVRAKILRPGGEPIKVDFVVQGQGEELKIKDVKIEGVSLLVTKRSEFDAVIAQKGLDGLIQALRAKVG